MARDFTKVSPTVWTSRKFKSLEGSNSKLFYLYVLMGPHQTSCGVSKIPLPYASCDIGFDLSEVKQNLEDCIDTGLLVHDPDTEEILITNWFKFNAPMNQNHCLGVDRGIERVESSKLAEIAHKSLRAVYFDPNAARPNTPPDTTNSNGDVVDIRSKQKRPNELSIGEFEASLRRRTPSK